MQAVVNVTVTIDIPIRKIDNKTTVHATNTIPFDAKIIRDKQYDANDMEGVIDDRDNPYDAGEPVTVWSYELPLEIFEQLKGNKMKAKVIRKINRKIRGYGT